jgi:hypothetical protein
MLRWLAICVALTQLTQLSQLAAAETPSERARVVLDAQLSALNDPSAFLATLSPDALVFGNGSFTLARGQHAAAIIATLSASPWSQLAVTQTTTLRLSAGGSADVVWLSAEIAMLRSPSPTLGPLPQDSEPLEDRTTARIVEIVVATKGTWQVVALAFASTSGVSAPGDLLGAPAAGPLTALLASPRQLDRASWADGASIVFGAHSGFGSAAASRVLAPLAKRGVKLSKAIEVNGNGWGVVAGDLEIGADPHAWWRSATTARVMLFAIRERTRWKLVALDTGTVTPAPLKIDP